MMLAHFQEEEVFGRAHGVRGDEIIITTIPNIITGVTLRIPSFSFFFYSLWGLPWLGLRCIFTFFCIFLFNHYFIPCSVFDSHFFGIPSRLCNLLYPPFFLFFCFQGGSVFISCGFISTPCCSTSISHSNYCYHRMFFYYNCLFLCF